MPFSEEDVKSCPIIAAFQGNKDATSTGASWASRCKGNDCAWWNKQKSACAITVLSYELGEIIPKGTLAGSI